MNEQTGTALKLHYAILALAIRYTDCLCKQPSDGYSKHLIMRLSVVLAIKIMTKHSELFSCWRLYDRVNTVTTSIISCLGNTPMHVYIPWEVRQIRNIGSLPLQPQVQCIHCHTQVLRRTFNMTVWTWAIRTFQCFCLLHHYIVDNSYYIACISC